MELDNKRDLRRKRSVQLISVGFLGLLIFLTLFSNTFQSITFPKVRTEQLASGGLLYKIEGSGTLRAVVEAQLTNPAGWTVLDILVQEGERVKKGQQLITYNSQSAERELDNELAHLKKMNLELQNLQDQFILSAKGSDEVESRRASRAIEMLKLDLSTQERKIQELRDRLASGRVLTAPFDGLVTSVNAVQGLGSLGEPDVVVSNSSEGYQLDVLVDSMPLTRLGIAVGAELEVEVQAAMESSTRFLEGTILEVMDAGLQNEGAAGEGTGETPPTLLKVLRIKVVDAELKGGERAKISIEGRSRLEGLVVSNEAIHRDREGKFVYKIEETRGALGNVFIVRKVRIPSSEWNDQETMLQAGSLYEGDLIVVESSEPLQDGNRVRLQ